MGNTPKHDIKGNLVVAAKAENADAIVMLQPLIIKEFALNRAMRSCRELR